MNKCLCVGVLTSFRCVKRRRLSLKRYVRSFNFSTKPLVGIVMSILNCFFMRPNSEEKRMLSDAR